MTPWIIGSGFLIALLVGFNVGHRCGVNDGVRGICAELDRLDPDHTILGDILKKWTGRK